MSGLRAKLSSIATALAIGLAALSSASAQSTPPPVEYDAQKLPAPVRDTRQRIIDAVKSGDIQRLRPLVKPDAPDVGGQPGDDTIEFLKTQSGDPQGREILAILLEILEAGFVHVSIGTPEEMYVWPYFAWYPIDRLTGPQMVELFKLVTAGDYKDMQDDGAYTFFRAGIRPDGTWDHFVAGH